MLGWSVLESPVYELRRAVHAFQTLAFELATKLRELKNEINCYCDYGNEPGEDLENLLESSHGSFVRLSIEAARRTVIHEFGRYFGMDENQLKDV